jgi:glycerol-3-phosphate dehydrogenase
LYDCIVIGAGVIGCAAARELGLYTPNVCVLEANSDVGEGTSKANSAIVHAGFDAETGSVKAATNVAGNRIFPKYCQELGVPFIQNGSLVLCFSHDRRNDLEALLQRGIQNGVQGLRIVEADELRSLEPNVSDNAVMALYAPTAGIVCPFTLCVALAENACANGVSFRFDQRVQGIERIDGGFAVHTGDNRYEGKTVINAAGVFADEVARMAGGKTCGITPRRGEYCVFDRTVGDLVRQTLFQLPGPMGKGVLVTPTVHKNLLVGPNAQDIEDKQDSSTTAEGLDVILSTGAQSVQSLPKNMVIASFAGLRAHPQDDDFHVGEDDGIPGFYHAAGIESPGLSSAPAIAAMLCEDIVRRCGLCKNKNAITHRDPIPRFLEMDEREREAAIAADHAYGNIVCRCETVTEAEVVQSIRRVPGAKTIDGVKRRVRCGTGRCQGGFCMPRVSAILMREQNLAMEEITKMGKDSHIVTGPIKEASACER